MLGLNPLEQEVLDLTNEVARNGFIFFPEFCSIVHRKYREEDESVFRQIMFKVNYSNKLGVSCAKLRLSLAWLDFPTEAELMLKVEFKILALSKKNYDCYKM